jgi:hypothetical protein
MSLRSIKYFTRDFDITSCNFIILIYPVSWLPVWRYMGSWICLVLAGKTGTGIHQPKTIENWIGIKV